MTLEEYLDNHAAQEGAEEELPTLLPCPFCGAEAMMEEAVIGSIIYCSWCGAKMGGYASAEEAAEAWNRRE